MQYEVEIEYGCHLLYIVHCVTCADIYVCFKYLILFIISSLFSLTTVTLYYDNSIEKMALHSNMETADNSVMTIHIYFPKSYV